MNTEIDKPKPNPLHGIFNGVDVVGVPSDDGKLYFPLSCLEQGMEYPAKGLTNQLARWLDKGLAREGVHAVKFTNGRLAALKVAAGGDQSAFCRLVGPNASHVWMLTEAGLYRILILSKRPQAIAFQDWLEQDLLPTINQTGMYIPEEKRKELEAAKTQIKALQKELEGRKATPKLLDGPIPLTSKTSGYQEEERAVEDAEKQGLAAVEAMDPAIRLKGRIFRLLIQRSACQLVWLRDTLEERAGKKPPTYQNRNSDWAANAEVHETRAQVVYLVRALPLPDLYDALSWAEQAQSITEKFNRPWYQKVLAEVGKLSESECRALWSLIDGSKEHGRRPHDARLLEATDVAIRLLGMGPAAIKEAHYRIICSWKLDHPGQK